MLEHTNKPEWLHIQLDVEEIRQLKFLLNRATNCLEPEKWPPIAKPLEEAVDNFIRKHDAV